MEIKLSLLSQYCKPGGFGEHTWQGNKLSAVSEKIKDYAQKLTTISSEVEGPAYIVGQFDGQTLFIYANRANLLDSSNRSHFEVEVYSVVPDVGAEFFPQLVDQAVAIKRSGRSLHNWQTNVEVKTFSQIDIPWEGVLFRLSEGLALPLSNTIQASALLDLFGGRAFKWMAVYNGKYPKGFLSDPGIVLCKLSNAPASTFPISSVTSVEVFARKLEEKSFFRDLVGEELSVRKAALNCICGAHELNDLDLLPWEIRRQLMAKTELSEALLRTLPCKQVRSWLASPCFSTEKLLFLDSEIVKANASDVLSRIKESDSRTFRDVEIVDSIFAGAVEVHKMIELLPIKSKMIYEALLDGKEVEQSQVSDFLSNAMELQFSNKIPAIVFANAARSGAVAARTKILSLLEGRGIPIETASFLVGLESSLGQPFLPSKITADLLPFFSPTSVMEGVENQSSQTTPWQSLFLEMFQNKLIRLDDVCEFSVKRCSVRLLELIESPAFLLQMLSPKTEIPLPPVRNSDWHPQCTLVLEQECHSLNSFVQMHPVRKDWEERSIFINRIRLAECGPSTLERREKLFEWLDSLGDHSQMKIVVGWLRSIFGKRSEPLGPRTARAALRLMTRMEVLEQIQIWSDKARSADRAEVLTTLCNCKELRTKEQDWFRSLLLDWSVLPEFPDSFSCKELILIARISDVDPMDVVRFCLRQNSDFVTTDLTQQLVYRLRTERKKPQPYPLPIEIRNTEWLNELFRLLDWSAAKLETQDGRG